MRKADASEALPATWAGRDHDRNGRKITFCPTAAIGIATAKAVFASQDPWSTSCPRSLNYRGAEIVQLFRALPARSSWAAACPSRTTRVHLIYVN